MQDLGIEVLFKGNNFIRLLAGLWVSVRLALIAMVFSILLGFLLGMVMTSKKRIVRLICRIYLEIVRIMPQLVLLFLVYFGAAKHLGINISGEIAGVIVFTFWGTAEMGDLVRSALIAVPKHQYESAYSLGLNKTQVYLQIILPQTIRRLLPSAVNLLTRMIKTTSLVVLIGVVEVVKVGKQIIDASRYQNPNAALSIYGVIFLLLVHYIHCADLSVLNVGVICILRVGASGGVKIHRHDCCHFSCCTSARRCKGYYSRQYRQTYRYERAIRRYRQASRLQEIPLM